MGRRFLLEALPLLHQVTSITREVERANYASLSDAPSLDEATLEASMAVSRRCKALKQGLEKRLEQILLLLEQAVTERAEKQGTTPELFLMEELRER